MSEGEASVADLQRQLAALESRNAALLAKADDAENEVAFHKKRFDTAVGKALAEKEEEIEQYTHSSTAHHHRNQHHQHHQQRRTGRRTVHALLPPAPGLSLACVCRCCCCAV